LCSDPLPGLPGGKKYGISLRSTKKALDVPPFDEKKKD
jgi:hypothetical protein